MTKITFQNFNFDTITTSNTQKYESECGPIFT